MGGIAWIAALVRCLASTHGLPLKPKQQRRFSTHVVAVHRIARWLQCGLCIARIVAPRIGSHHRPGMMIRTSDPHTAPPLLFMSTTTMKHLYILCSHSRGTFAPDHYTFHYHHCPSDIASYDFPIFPAPCTPCTHRTVPDCTTPRVRPHINHLHTHPPTC